MSGVASQSCTSGARLTIVERVRRYIETEIQSQRHDGERGRGSEFRGSTWHGTVIKTLSKQVVEGVAYLHENRIMHCDLKCDNIFLSSRRDNEYPRGEVKIGDLNHAASFDDHHSEVLGARRPPPLPSHTHRPHAPCLHAHHQRRAP